MTLRIFSAVIFFTCNGQVESLINVSAVNYSRLIYLHAYTLPYLYGYFWQKRRFEFNKIDGDSFYSSQKFSQGKAASFYVCSPITFFQRAWVRRAKWNWLAHQWKYQETLCQADLQCYCKPMLISSGAIWPRQNVLKNLPQLSLQN